MIVRILGEGQWVLDEQAVAALNGLDDAVEQAVQANDEQQLAAALHSLLEQVRSSGAVVPDDALQDSDLILPSSDATLDEVRRLLDESEEGLIPG
ncbi:hypothetical protein GCM10009841_15570 [Microlunatus panaciterrae]|uniref:PspA-associated domain-containing protein n=1 Tax=Microlunatus panaciterrae TaxID=400768 RepID=A0ABS2RM97_9ACTN|nr:hypothetical protein [Microlunatus panaciterrae]MBM7800115.1 hypothetical protein [Microlunatus panaciterrae]